MNHKVTRQLIIEKRGYPKDIKGDKFSLYISTPNLITLYLKKRIGNRQKTLVELCCGIGVNLLNLGSVFKKLIGVDVDKKILSACFKNLSQAGLMNKTELIRGDITNDDILRKIKADIVIYDVPYWSSHESESKGNLKRKNPNFKVFINRIRKFVSKDIIVFVPPHYTYEFVKNSVGDCEYQQIFMGKKYDRNIIYLGGLKKKSGVVQKEFAAT